MCPSIIYLKDSYERTTEHPYISGGLKLLAIHDTYYQVYTVTGDGIWCFNSPCFVAGTQVIYSLNGDAKAIEKFAAGDDVLSYDVETGEDYIAKVQKLIVSENKTDLAIVTFANGVSITMTPDHPIYCADGFKSLTGYKGFEEPCVGDKARIFGGWSDIVSIERFTSEPTTVYNLAIKDEDEIVDDDTNDTFYANGVCVHNRAEK